MSFLNHNRMYLALCLGSTVVIAVLIALCPPVGIAVFLLLVFFWAIVVKPATSILLVIVLLPMLNIGFVYDNPIRIVDEFMPISALAIIVVLLSHALRTPLLPPRQIVKGEHDSLINLLFVLFLACIVPSAVWTTDISHALNKIFLTLLCFAMVKLLPELIKTEQDLRRVLKGLSLLGLVLAAELILSDEYSDFKYSVELLKDLDFIVLLHTYGSSDKLRLGGFAPVNLAANYLVILIFIDLAIGYSKSWKSRLWLLAHGLLMFYCILKTGSKAGIGSLLLAFAFFPLIIPELRDKVIRITSAGIVVITAGLLVAGTVLIKRLQVMTEGETGFLEDRIGWWTEGFRNLYNTCGIGTGIGGFPKLIDPVPAAHSFYFSILFELGIVGYVILMFLIGIIVYCIVKSYRRMPQGDLRFAMGCLLASFIAVLIHGTVDFEYTYMPPWFLLGLMLAIARISNTEQAETTTDAKVMGNDS